MGRNRPPAGLVGRADRGTLAAAPGELAGERGWVVITRAALVLGFATTVRLPWEQVERADWDPDTSRLRVLEVGEFGQRRDSWDCTLAEPGRVPEAVRERVTASVVLQRPVRVDGRWALQVIGRRSPAGGPTGWFVEYAAGVDPDDPRVAAAADEAVTDARQEAGDVP